MKPSPHPSPAKRERGQETFSPLPQGERRGKKLSPLSRKAGEGPGVRAYFYTLCQIINFLVLTFLFKMGIILVLASFSFKYVEKES